MGFLLNTKFCDLPTGLEQEVIGLSHPLSGSPVRLTF
jgi:hypothetical protein